MTSDPIRNESKFQINGGLHSTEWCYTLISRVCVSGTCWNTPRVWGSGCRLIPRTSSLFTAKAGKVIPLFGRATISNWTCAQMLIFAVVSGRTGTLVCTWLIDSDQFESAQVRRTNEVQFRQEIPPSPPWLFIWFHPWPNRTVWSILGRGGQTRVEAPSFKEWRRPLRLDDTHRDKAPYNSAQAFLVYDGFEFCFVRASLQSRYVGYYEIMKTKFNRRLPPPKSLKIKSIRIHSIAGPAQHTHTHRGHNMNCTMSSSKCQRQSNHGFRP